MTLPNFNLPSSFEAIRILLLEDYKLDADLVSAHLKRSHPLWTVDHVASKEAFVEQLENNPPHVIVSDYSLPSFSGIDAFNTCKSMGVDVPFIILTGHLPEESARECVHDGIDDYVLKSALSRLDHSIERAIQRRSAEMQRNDFAVKLNASERRYKSIFDQAGVALAEFQFDNLLEELDHPGVSPEERKEKLAQMCETLRVTAANKAVLRLFQVASREEFSEHIQRFFGRGGLRVIARNAMQLANGETSTEQMIEASTSKGHSRSLLVKTVIDPSRNTFITVSFTDMTQVRESELRAMRLVERLEDTVAQRVRELSGLNEKLQQEAKERERINSALRDNYIQMTESIIAAKRIQQLLLPRQSEISNTFQDAFVYMRPKGIVSGDFYWFHSDGNKHWVACVDCTGHGVPGAFMSMLSSKLLNQAVIENNLSNPAEVLKSIDSYVVRELKQRDASTLVSTGMDISLCLFNTQARTVQFSGAYQNLIVKKGNQVELVRGDRYSLGGTFEHLSKSYTLHERKLSGGEFFYMFTDGIVDQFGGPGNKKFTRKRLMALLSELQTDNMYEQELAIKSRLQDWKGTNEQVDDILVMGIRI